jgi:NitT/TauT family transport system permease protein
MRVLISRLVVLAILLGLWELAAFFAPLFIATPEAVLRVIMRWSVDGTLRDNLGVTLLEVAMGGVLAFAVGIPVGLALAQSKLLDAATRPYIDVINSIPRLGLAPLFVLWFGLGLTSKVALIFSVVVFVVIVNTHAGVKGVSAEHLILARVLGATRRDIALKIIMPTLIPWLVASLRLGGAHAVAAAVIAEFVAGNKGIGYLLAYRSSVLDAAGSFAALFVLALLAGVMTLGTMALEHYSLRWRRIESGEVGEAAQLAARAARIASTASA